MIDAEFTQLCSEKTLHTDREGFFSKFVQTLIENVKPKWIKTVFGKKRTDLERMKCIYEDNEIEDYVIDFLSNVQEIYRGKDEKISEKLLSEATKTSDIQKSLNFYNQAILKLPTGVILCNAIYRRSFILFALGNYSNCLCDLQFVQSQLSIELKMNAYWLMALSYKAVNQPEKANIAFDLSEKIVRNKNLLNFLRQLEFQPIISVNKPQKDFSYVSSKLKVTKSETMGRYVIAGEPIRTGEVLVVEHPEVSCLLPEKFGTRCQHCFDKLLAPVGCPDCSSVAFCSPQCQKIAVNSYHKFECKVMDLLIGSGMSVLSLAALRYVTQKSLNKKTLCTNSEKRKSEDFLQRTLMAAFLLRCLQKTGYFGDNRTVIPTEAEFEVGADLLYYLQMLQFNAHEIVENQTVGKLVNLGVAVYPTVSLFNHECYPAVCRCVCGNLVSTQVAKCQCGDHVTIKKHVEELDWCERQYQVASECLKQVDFEKARHLLCQALDCFHRVSKPPHVDTHAAEDNLRLCLVRLGVEVLAFQTKDDEKFLDMKNANI